MSNLGKKGYAPVNLVFYKANQEIIYEVQTICAYHKDTKEVVQIGEDAINQENNRDIIVENPLKWGVIGNYTIFSKMAAICMKKAPKKLFKKLKLALCIPANLSEVEAMAFKDAFAEAEKVEVVDIIQASFSEMIENNQSYDIYVDFVSDYYKSEYFE